MSIAIRRILVLCEGNHCRSPLAEALLRRALGPASDVRSAGFRALVGEPAHEETRRQGMELGLDLSTHRGRQVTLDLAKRADLILVMDRAQKAACEALAPSVRGRVFLLGHWLSPDRPEIADPIRRSAADHRRVGDHIQGAIQTWLPRLARRTP
jgi:protein-tyrosine phosphatase